MLNNNNYFSHENELKYFGSTQFKRFLKCEAEAMAILHGKYDPGTTTALLVGSYVDAYFDGTLPAFIDSHPEIINGRTGSLKSDYAQADNIIERCEQDELFMKFMGGQKQVIKTAEVFGVPWKIKIDSYHPGKMIVDLKVMKDFEPVYVPGQGKVGFVEAYGYDIQGAIYQAVEQQARIDAGEKDAEKLPFFIAAATKQKDATDLGIFQLPQQKLDDALRIVEHYIEEFAGVKAGYIYPRRCETCAWCRQTKKLLKVKQWEDINGD